jgi:Ca-activated chloride channel family protein
VRVSDSVLALVLIAVVLGATSWALLGRREESGVRRGSTPFARRDRARRAKRVAAVLMGGAVLFLVLSFTQFRFLREESAAGTVVLAMDASESMSRSDVEPTRLEAARAAAERFLDELPAELRVGLVSFAGVADVLVTPTTERGPVVAALGELPRGEGTVIGDGLAASLDAIEDEWERAGETDAVVVLLSDGRDTGSAVTPEAAADRAATLGVRVYTVVLGRAIGTGGGGANVALLAEIAQTTEASSYTADTAGGLLDVYDTLRSEISTELGISGSGALFVGIAAAFAIGATVAILFALRLESLA